MFMLAITMNSIATRMEVRENGAQAVVSITAMRALLGWNYVLEWGFSVELTFRL